MHRHCYMYEMHLEECRVYHAKHNLTSAFKPLLRRKWLRCIGYLSNNFPFFRNASNFEIFFLLHIHAPCAAMGLFCIMLLQLVASPDISSAHRNVGQRQECYCLYYFRIGIKFGKSYVRPCLWVSLMILYSEGLLFIRRRFIYAVLFTRRGRHLYFKF